MEMKYFRIRSLACIFFFILLSGCGDSNPFIGKWEPSSHGPIQAMSFTKDEMTSVSAKGATASGTVKYKQEGSKWLISFDDGKTYESPFEFKDKNTMILKENEVELTFKKVRSFGDEIELTFKKALSLGDEKVRSLKQLF